MVFIIIGLIIGNFVCGLLAFILYRLFGDEYLESDFLGIELSFGYIMLPLAILLILYERLKKFVDSF